MSVIVPLHNYGAFLPDLFSGLRSQTYDNWECLVVDDGSTDDSVSAAEHGALVDSRVQVLRQARGGALSCVRAALPRLSGSIVCVVDADDTVLPKRFQALVDAFASAPNVGFVAHPLYVTDHRLTVLGQLPLGDAMPSGDLRPILLRSHGRLTGLGVTSGMAVRREVLDWLLERSCFPAVGSYVDEFLRRCVPLLTAVLSLDDVLGLRRLHGSNISAAAAERLSQQLDHLLVQYRAIIDVQQQVLDAVGLGGTVAAADDLDLLSMTLIRCRLGGGNTKTARAALFASPSFAALAPPKAWYWRAVAFAPRRIALRLVRSFYSPLGLKPLLNHLRFRLSGRRTRVEGLRYATTRAILLRTLRGGW